MLHNVSSALEKRCVEQQENGGTYGAEDLDGHVLVEEAEDDAEVLLVEVADFVHDGGVVHERLGRHVLALRLEQLAQRVQRLRARAERTTRARGPAAPARARRASVASSRGERQAGSRSG